MAENFLGLGLGGLFVGHLIRLDECNKGHVAGVVLGVGVALRRGLETFLDRGLILDLGRGDGLVILNHILGLNMGALRLID